MKRLLPRILLAFALATAGFGLALGMATEFVYPGPANLDSGLARVSFALRGAFGGLALGVLLGFWLKASHVLRAALVALLIGAVALGITAWRSAKQRAARDAARGANPTSMPYGHSQLP